MRNMRGFTLLEVIVALGIVSVGILAVSRAMTGYVGSLANAEDRVVANWVAVNQLETLRLTNIRPVAGTGSGVEEMAGRMWRFETTTSATADEALFRVDVRVFAAGDDESEAGSVFGYLRLAPDLK